MYYTLLALMTLSLSLLPIAQMQALPTVEDATLEGLVGQVLGGPPLTFYVGEAPEGLLEHVPIPEGLPYYGATLGPQGSTVILSLEAEHAPTGFEDLVMGYEALLEAGGWTGVSTVRQEAVFILRDTLYDSRARPETYCHEESGRALQLSPVVEQGAVASPQGGPSGLRLHLDSPFAQQLCLGEAQPFSLHQPLPTLELPEGVRLQGSSSGTGGSYAEASVSFSSQMSREAMLEHLAAQLAQAGWERQEEASLGAHLLLALTLEEEGQAWHALLTVQGDDEGAYAVTLRADTRPELRLPAERQGALSVAYLQHALVLSSPQGAAVVAFTPDIEDGASYRYRLLRQGSHEEETGQSSVFEKYLREPSPSGQGHRLTDAGSRLFVRAGPLRVEWSMQRTEAGWIYHQDAGVTATIVDLELFETLELRDYLP